MLTYYTSAKFYEGQAGTLRNFPLNRAVLARHFVRYLVTGKLTQCDVWLAKVDGRLFVVKDFLNRPWLIRALLGRFTIRVEANAYEAFPVCDHVPGFYGMLDDYAFVLEYIDGKPLKDFQAGELPISVLHQLEYIVHNLHRNRIAHGDLKKFRNILILPDARVVILDLSATFHLTDRPGNWFTRVFLRFWQREDLKALAKVKLRFFPEARNQLDEVLEAQLPFVEPPVRFIRDLKRRLLRHFRSNGKGNGKHTPQPYKVKSRTTARHSAR